MGRKLRTYITSEGFFDKAIAAPSMKAALNAWGSKHNLFHQGFAKETDDPAIIAATMKEPGVVLKRPVGSNDTFKKHARLPHSLLPERPDAASQKRKGRLPEKHTRTTRNEIRKRDSIAIKEFERERKHREKERRKDEALQKKNTMKREAAFAKARAALQEAEKRHDKAIGALKARQDAINQKIEAAETKREVELKRLETAVRKAGE